jgi:threonine synthase
MALANKFPVHVVQPFSCSPISEVFDKRTGELEPVLADAIVDKVALRKDTLVDKLKANEGGAWTVTNLEIAQAVRLAEESEGLKLSPNGALGLAGLHRAMAKGWKTKKPVICLITGQ